jgi:hypothetical protein
MRSPKWVSKQSAGVEGPGYLARERLEGFGGFVAADDLTE